MKYLPLTTGRISATLLATGLALAACSGPKAADQTAAAPASASASQADPSATPTDSTKKSGAGGKHKSRRHRSAAKKTAAGK